MDIWGDLESTGYEGIDANVEDLLSNSSFNVNVFFATEAERNFDMGSIVNAFGNDYREPRLEDVDAEDLDNALSYLVNQQGHSIAEVYGNGDNAFIRSVREEIDENSSEAMSELRALVRMDGQQMLDFIEKRNEAKDSLVLPKDYATMGIFNQWSGCGGMLDIRLEKDAVLPLSMVRGFQVEGQPDPDGYTVNDTYDNPLGGNRIIARGSIGRWDGTRHGMTAYRDFDDMMSGPDSVFKDCEIGKIWDENGSLFIHGYHHDGGVDVEVRQLTDAGEEALDVIEDAWYGEPFTSGGKEYDGSPESVDTAMRDLWEDPDLCPTPRYMELAFGCPAEEYEAPAIDPLLEAAEFTPSAIMSAEVAPGAVTATVHDVSGVPYEVPADVLNGLKDAVRISDRAATIEPSASLTIDGWNQKLDDSLWALDFEDRNGVPPQLSDWLARDAEGEKGNESAKTSPVSLKTAAEEAHAVSTMLSKKNGGTDEQDGKDDLQRHMIPSEMRIPSQNDHHRAPSLSDIAAETRAASAAMETNIASRIDRERDAR